MPLTIEYPVLRTLVVQSAFTGPGESRTILNDQGGCTRLIISNPQYSLAGSQLRLDIRVSARAGHLFGSNCIAPVQWEGYLSFIQIPQVNRDNWRLVFKTVNSAIYDLNHRPGNMAELLWNIIRDPIHRYISGISVNLAPPAEDLKNFLFPLFPPESVTNTRAMLGSMRIGEVSIAPEGLKAELLVDAQTPEEAEPPASVSQMSPQELDRAIEGWEAWDGFLVLLFGMLGKEALIEDERQLLLDVLLELRYRFVAEIANQSLARDFVRDQFITTWRKLRPLYKNHLGKDPADNILGYLAFFTASDALVSLDRVGPALGIEISRDGLFRLLRMLDPNSSMPGYDRGINLQLRKVLGLEPSPGGSLDNSGMMDQELESIPLEPESVVEENVPEVERQQALPSSEAIPQVFPEQEPQPFERNRTIPDPVEREEPTDQAGPSPEQEAPVTSPENQGEIEEFYLEPEEANPPQAPEKPTDPLSLLLDFIIAPVCAAESRSVPGYQEIRQWQVPKNNIDGYLERVKAVLGDAAAKKLLNDSKRKKQEQFYRNLVLSTAWQESCFRQFVVKNDQLSYLRSYNGSSVGIMQINERVWRGFYDLNRLRWDISYNALAGTEILELYMNKYVFGKKGKKTELQDETLAGVVYAMYNGGPAEYGKFLERQKKNSLYKSDKLFLEKYRWTSKKQWDRFDGCLAR